MQFEIAHASCPLCKRPLSASPAGRAPDTRLCDPCRNIVQTAFLGARARFAVPATTVPNNGANALVHDDAPANCLQIDYSVFVEDGLTAVESLEEDAESCSSFELYDELNPEPDHRQDLREHNDVDDGTRALEADLSDLRQEGSFEPQGGESITSFETKPPDAEEFLPHDEPRLFDKQAEGSPSTPATPLDYQRDESHASDDKAVLDPWENPLPAWDYSHNEWPVLVGPSDRRRFRRLRAPLAALVALAFAAGFYFLARPQSSLEQPPAVSVNPVAVEGKPAAAEPQSSASSSANSVAQGGSSLSSSNAPASADVKPAQTAAAEPASSGDDGNLRGRFSLQAAAFPNQPAADEFAEKLRRAGVPSYVVSTDLARRGRWFRVRVGRFNAADEAQRFAAEVQLRARAAGMSLQLIACQYEQP